jgi:hypothetical protein
MPRRKNDDKSEDEAKEVKKPRKKKTEDGEEDGDADIKDLIQEDSIMSEDDDFEDEEIIGEIDEEDEEKEVMKHLKDYGKTKEVKIISVFEKIGSPECPKPNDMKDNDFSEEYGKLIALLDKNNIIVHFKNDYPIKEKYRFVTEEVFNQDIEDFKKSKVHVNFIYEDFHPEMDDEDEDEDFDYDYNNF